MALFTMSRTMEIKQHPPNEMPDPFPQPLGPNPPKYDRHNPPAMPGSFGSDQPLDPNRPDNSTAKRNWIYTW